MSVINEILPFAAEAQENLGEVLSLTAYQDDVQRRRGNQPGLARLELVNTVLRQTSHMAAGLAQFAAKRYASGVKDNGDLDAVEEALNQAIRALIKEEATGSDALLAQLEAWRKAQIGKLAYFTRGTLPEGWVKCDGSLALFADWPEFKEAYDEGAFTGMTLAADAGSELKAAWKGKFILNDANPTGLFVPDLQGLFLRNMGSQGAYHKPGVPNITALWDTPEDDFEITAADKITTAGAAVAPKRAARQYTTPTGKTSSGTTNFSFDASKASAIYGASSTVMPESVDLALGLYLGRPA